MSLQPRKHTILVAITGLVGLLLLHFTAHATTGKQPHWQNKHYIEHSFYDIALQGEHQVVQPVIKKWRQPLRIWASSTTGNAHHQYSLLNTHLKKLANITRLIIQPAQNPQHANVRIFFTAEQEANQVVSREISPAAMRHMQQSICLGHIRYNHAAEITQATIVIPVQRAQSHGKLASCVIEELTQMLGLINDSEAVHPTVFNDTSHNDMLTGLDYLLLKLLYAPEIKTGMTASQAAPLVRKRLYHWEQNGIISQADQLINQPRWVRRQPDNRRVLAVK